VTAQTYGFYDEQGGVYLPTLQFPPFGERLPMFNQLDIRVDKSWKTADGRISLYLDIQNVYNSGNVEGVVYNYNQTKRTYATGLPIIPSIGARGEF
jgi:hypothetical protein